MTDQARERPAAGMTADQKVAEALREADEACPCRPGGRAATIEPCGRCKCRGGTTPCLWPGHAAIAALVAAAREATLEALANLDSLTVEEVVEGTEIGKTLRAMIESHEAVAEKAGYERGRADSRNPSLDEALNMGDGVYRP